VGALRHRPSNASGASTRKLHITYNNGTLTVSLQLSNCQQRAQNRPEGMFTRSFSAGLQTKTIWPVTHGAGAPATANVGSYVIVFVNATGGTFNRQHTINYNRRSPSRRCTHLRSRRITPQRPGCDADVQQRVQRRLQNNGLSAASRRPGAPAVFVGSTPSPSNATGGSFNPPTTNITYNNGT
jgi:hypothetical protein